MTFDPVRLVLAPTCDGYMLDGEFVGGFADRDDLPAGQRYSIAAWARRFTPDSVSDQQHQLLQSGQTPEDRDDRRSRRVDIQTLTHQHHDEELDHLSDDQRRWVQWPHTHPATPDAQYPLSAEQVASLAQQTEQTIHAWTDAGKIAALPTRGERRYGRNATVAALLLARAEDDDQVAETA